jgi:putative SOS response-associated peptidase YedK
VILDPGAYDAWLDPAVPSEAAKGLLLANLDSELQFHRVSRTVNSVKNQGGNCIDPINPL